ncbi:MAG: phosphoglycerate dehydrogenase [Acidobacteria bacterium]|nr:phosphoglycerate dehydrogenase [Acidobacteriota bacterium]
MNILIADAVSPSALEVLRAEPGWRVIASSPKEFQAHLPDAHALLIRSGAQVTAEVLAKAPNLRVIGRAGVGIDNVDVDAATSRGVLVMNTPGGNAISVAEHTLALMLAAARSIPAASESTKAGKWEKKKFLGTELNGKTLGIVGLGNIGLLVARRARPFGMKLLAYDPFVNPEIARDRGVEMVTLDELYAASDYISLHLSLNENTRNLLNNEAFAKMKDGVRIINCARGELIDATAIEQALASGKVAAVGLDVFPEEPPQPGSPLLTDPRVIATPHIGGSTEEAQETVGIRIAEQVRDYLKTGVVLNAVNMPSINAEQYDRIRPDLDLAERLGSFAAQIATGRPKRVQLIYSGNLGKTSSGLVRNAALSGILKRYLSSPPNLINANLIAEERGLSVSESRHGRSYGSDSLTIVIETDEGQRTAEGTVFSDGFPRLISVDGIFVETRLIGHMVFTKNIDVPGVIGRMGTLLGENKINIADFSLGREENHQPASEPAVAVAVVRIDGPLPKTVLEKLLKLEAVQYAQTIELPA